MSQERSEAIVLRGVDFSETSRIVTFLAPARGKLACMALGARRVKGGMGGALDTLNRLELVYYWKDGRSVQKLGEAALLDSYGSIKADLEKSLHAAFPLELVYKVAHENEPSEALYASLVHGFEGLTAWRGDARTHTCWHVFHLLSVAGFGISLEGCAECGQPVDVAAGFSYAGGVTCSRCRGDVRLAPEDLATLETMAERTDACPRVAASPRVLTLLKNYAARQLDTDFRSVRVIEETLG
ncbi:MAG: DNA repair protein RecO [FCB group bacterium]|nr:DNA repair protein RecO [FCB group bacterium]